VKIIEKGGIIHLSYNVDTPSGDFFYAHDFEPYKPIIKQSNMKTLVKTTPTVPTITIEELRGDELICYKCKGTNHKDGVAVLTELPYNSLGVIYGFINLGYSNSLPTYLKPTRNESIAEAMKNRTLRVFNTQKEMLTAILNNEV
jgi:hypothetical protein